MEFFKIIFFASLIFSFTPPFNSMANTLRCPKGQYLVRAHWRMGYYRSDGIRVSPAKVSAYCKNYRTRKPLVLQFHNVKKGTSKEKKYKNFSKKEERQIRKAFKKIPQILTDVGKVMLYRQGVGKYPKNPASVNSKNKRIVLYDNIFNDNVERILAHELAHILYYNLSKKARISYEKVAGWKVGVYSNGHRKVFVASDGQYSPSEDFANNVEYYLYEEIVLKNKNPKIYKWIKQFMGGEIK